MMSVTDSHAMFIAAELALEIGWHFGAPAPRAKEEFTPGPVSLLWQFSSGQECPLFYDHRQSYSLSTSRTRLSTTVE